MARHIALLRAVNLGGATMVAMADLRQMLTGMGFGDVRSLLNSGNLVFDSDDADGAALEARLAAAAQARFGRTFDFMVRDAGAWRRMVQANPFPGQAQDDPSHLVAMILDRPADPAGVAALRAAVQGRERIEAGEACVYLVYPDGIGRSKLTNAVIDRRLGRRGTGRNWNTVLKLAALVEA